MAISFCFSVFFPSHKHVLWKRLLFKYMLHLLFARWQIVNIYKWQMVVVGCGRSIHQWWSSRWLACRIEIFRTKGKRLEKHVCVANFFACSDIFHWLWQFLFLLEKHTTSSEGPATFNGILHLKLNVVAPEAIRNTMLSFISNCIGICTVRICSWNGSQPHAERPQLAKVKHFMIT